jgi:hypothetical protein
MGKLELSDFYYLKYNGFLLKSCNNTYCLNHRIDMDIKLAQLKDKIHTLIVKAKNKDDNSLDRILNIYASSIRKLLHSKEGRASQKCSYKYCSNQMKESLLSVINIVKNISEKSIRNGEVQFNKYSKKIKKEKNEKYKKIYITKAENISNNMKKAKILYDRMIKYENTINNNKLTIDDIINIKVDTMRNFMKAI